MACSIKENASRIWVKNKNKICNSDESKNALTDNIAKTWHVRLERTHPPIWVKTSPSIREKSEHTIL